MKYKEVENLIIGNWTDASGVKISIEDIVKLINDSGCDVYVGSDSNPARVPFVLAISIAIVKTGKFALYYYVRHKPWEDAKKPTIRERLEREVYSSCLTADMLRGKCPNVNIVVHADVNPAKESRSGKFATQLQNYIKGYGFEGYIKPDSWAASAIADKHAK